MKRVLALLFLLALPSAAQQPSIFDYIKTSWSTLERTHANLLEAARDPKFGDRAKWTVYVSAREDREAVLKALQAAVKPADLAQLEIRTLPGTEPGLLYLPRPYVVPGGRFNEMYGWDSYFILLGLLRDGEVRRAEDLVENQLYEVQHYGKVLNANRSYYLSRSQPPFLSRMVLELYEAQKQQALLERAWPALESTWRFWNSPPHLTPTGLSRYYDLADGPAPEVLAGETDKDGKSHYQKIQEHFRAHPQEDYGYDLTLYYDRARDELTPLFYKGDRSMRESGFDPSNRFGAFNLDVIHYNPVELNTLLWVLEKDMGRIARLLGKEPRLWEERAAARSQLISRYLWDEQAGLYFDYNFLTKRRRAYPFATTFFPLWAGLASSHQAARVMDGLAKLERPGGLVTSLVTSGNQWDSPFGWAPLQLVAVEGMRRYGYNGEADRVTMAFLSLVLQEYRKTGTIVEKYDVIRRSAQVSEGIAFGYSTNEIGFGWTNAAFLKMYDALPNELRARLLEPSE